MFQRMQKREETSQYEAPGEALPSIESFRAVPRGDRMTEADLEDYLDHLCVPLVGTMSYPERQEFREEMRGRLEAVIGAHQELGADREEAISSALRPLLCATVSSAATVRKTSSRLLGRSRDYLLGLASFSSAAVFSWLLLFYTRTDINYSTHLWLHVAVAMVPPLLAGAVVGKRAAKNPYKSTWLAIAALAGPSALVYQAWANAQGFTYPVEAGLGFAAVHATFWAVFGTAGTAMGSWFRKAKSALKLTAKLHPGA